MNLTVLTNPIKFIRDQESRNHVAFGDPVKGHCNQCTFAAVGSIASPPLTLLLCQSTAERGAMRLGAILC